MGEARLSRRSLVCGQLCPLAMVSRDLSWHGTCVHLLEQKGELHVQHRACRNRRQHALSHRPVHRRRCGHRRALGLCQPIQLVPGVIQWRIFAFLPPLVGILLGWRSGFICGYLGTIVWSLLAGTFIPAHSLIVDGIMVGLTASFRACSSIRRRADDPARPWLKLRQPARGRDRHGARRFSQPCLSRHLSFWWAFGYLGLSDIVPMIIGTPLLVIPALKILKSAHPSGFQRF